MKKSLKKSFFAASALALCVATFVGCSGKPSGFPKVSPCAITVVDGGTGIADVEVALIPDEPISGVVVGGKTDATGKCVVQTTFANFSAPGAPKGEFVVTLRKDPEVATPELTVEQMGEMSRGDIDKYNADRDAEIKKAPQIIPPNLTSRQTSDAKISVPGESSKEIDVAKFK